MRSRLAGVVALLGALFMVIGTGLTLTAASGTEDHKVRLCHAAGGSGTYTSIEVDKSSVINETAHGGHAHERDIIPPFEGYPGRNWTVDGQAIYANHCKAPSQQEPDVEVTASEPSASDPCGTSEDTYTVPSTTGVDYLVGGSVVTAGQHSGSGSVTVTAQAKDGYKLVGDASWTFHFTDQPCEQPDEDQPVTAAAPSASDPCGTSEDTYTVPSTTGVDYLVGGSVVTAGQHSGSGSVTVTAQAQDGYKLTGDSSWTFDFSDQPCEQPDEDQPVTAAAPSASDPCGTSKDTYTVPSTTGVDYLVGGSVVTAGKHSGSGSVTVTAQAQNGYKLVGDASWTFHFTDEACEEEPGEEKPGEEKPGEKPDDDTPSDKDSDAKDDAEDSDAEQDAPATKAVSSDSADATGGAGSTERSDYGALPAAAGGSVPTAVDAGLTRSTLSSTGASHGQLGLGLLGVGLALLAIGGLLKTGRRRECLR